MAQLVKNPPANAGDASDTSLIPRRGRSPAGGNSSPLQYSCLGYSMDRGAWWAAIYGVTQSRTRLKWLSSSKDVKKLEILNTAGENRKWCSHSRKVWQVLKKLNTNLPYSPAISLLGIHLREMKMDVSTKTITHECSHQHHSKQASSGERTKGGLPTQWNATQPPRGMEQQCMLQQAWILKI